MFRGISRTTFSRQSLFAKQTLNNFKLNAKTNTRFQTRRISTYPNISQTNNTAAIVTGAAGTMLLLGGGYYALKYLNGPREIKTYSATGEPIVYKDTSTMLTEGVHDYLKKVFGYVGAGAGVTATAAVLAYRSGLVNSIMMMGPLGSIGMFAGTIGLMYATRAVSVDNTLLKHAMFTAFNGVMGLSLCTLGVFAPTAILVRAGLYTLGVVGGLTLVATNAREERFLMWGGALSSALLVLIIASFGRIFLPARFARLGSALDALWLYGGLAIFSGLMLFDTQLVMRNAKQYEEIKHLAVTQGGPRALQTLPKPDYMAESIGIYLNMVNIFIRFVMILSNSKNRK